MTYRIDLKPETQRAVEAAAARQGVSVEAFIANAAETYALGGSEITNPLKNALALLETLTPVLRAGTKTNGVPLDAAAELHILRAERFADAEN